MASMVAASSVLITQHQRCELSSATVIDDTELQISTPQLGGNRTRQRDVIFSVEPALQAARYFGCSVVPNSACRILIVCDANNPHMNAVIFCIGRYDGIRLGHEIDDHVFQRRFAYPDRFQRYRAIASP